VVGQCYWEDVMYGEGVTWSEDMADEFVLVWHSKRYGNDILLKRAIGNSPPIAMLVLKIKYLAKKCSPVTIAFWGDNAVQQSCTRPCEVLSLNHKAPKLVCIFQWEGYEESDTSTWPNTQTSYLLVCKDSEVKKGIDRQYIPQNPTSSWAIVVTAPAPSLLPATNSVYGFGKSFAYMPSCSEIAFTNPTPHLWIFEWACSYFCRQVSTQGPSNWVEGLLPWRQKQCRFLLMLSYQV
jgi:hypothetical protein